MPEVVSAGAQLLSLGCTALSSVLSLQDEAQLRRPLTPSSQCEIFGGGLGPLPSTDSPLCLGWKVPLGAVIGG